MDEEFREFVAARSGRLLAAAYLMTGDRATAEDLLQTTLAKLWLAWRRVRAADSPEAYARRVMANTYAAWWRRRWRNEQPTESVPERAAAAATDGIDNRDEMWRALQALPRKQRAVLVLRYYEDMTEAEVAAALGVAVGTVKSQTAKAIANLRRGGTLHASRPALTKGEL